MVVVLCPDVFFLVAIRNTLRRLGFEPNVVRTTDDLEESASSLTPALVVIDMSAIGPSGDWDAVQPYLRHGVPVLAFGPHKDVEVFRAAQHTPGQLRDGGGLIARGFKGRDEFEHATPK
jgi:hypothetical protein